MTKWFKSPIQDRLITSQEPDTWEHNSYYYAGAKTIGELIEALTVLPPEMKVHDASHDPLFVFAQVGDDHVELIIGDTVPSGMSEYQADEMYESIEWVLNQNAETCSQEQLRQQPSY